MTDLAATLCTVLLESGRAKASDVVGCSEDEIALVEQKVGRQLPEAYKKFLRIMGNGAGNFQTDATWQLKYFDDIRRDVLESLRREDHFKVSPEMFVFLESGGSQFLFFYPAAGDDPPVFLYEMPDESPHQVADSFSAWIQLCIDQLIRTQRRGAKL